MFFLGLRIPSFSKGGEVQLAVICHKDPKNFPKCYKKSPSVYIKIHYYYIPQEELWAKYENVINKVEQKEELTDMEALDIAFIPKFISKDKAPFVTEYLAKTFKDAIITDNELKRDVGVILGAMILKNIKSDEKQNELMEDIGMKQIEEEIRILARDEYKEDYRKLEKEKYELQQENNAIKKEYDAIKKENNSIKKGILKLSKIDDLDPDAKKIINSLLIIH